MTQLTADVSATATRWPVDSSVPAATVLQVDDEIVRVSSTNYTRGQIVVQRAQEGTTAATHASGTELVTAFGGGGGGDGILEQDGSSILLDVADGEFRVSVHDGDPETTEDVIVVNNDSVRIRTDPLDTGTYFQVRTVVGEQALVVGFNDGTDILMPVLPTADPSIPGQLWNDGGTLKVSAG